MTILTLWRDCGGDTGRVRFSPDVLRVREFVVFFPLHPSVLEPDFDLALGKAEGVSNFYPSPACQVAIEVEFFLQF